ncbi:DUF1850 domain-containing protein [Haloarchaeobius amylolyticus]|uniref:DUF1850 domain-containing protein n=1 Tax=Haloarchaeobius amylolyticus TaxID=1198296 RepID=A0ABD6BKN8_9EURY
MVVAVLVLVGATATVTSTASAHRTLVVTDTDTDERLLSVPVDDGDVVTLSYTHSVEKTAIEDIYVVDGTQLRMDRMVFHSHGAGLPSDAPVETTEEGLVLEVDESYDEIGVVPGSIAGHELIVDGERYDLVSLSDGDVTLTVTEQTLVGDLLESTARTVSIDEPKSAHMIP